MSQKPYSFTSMPSIHWSTLCLAWQWTHFFALLVVFVVVIVVVCLVMGDSGQSLWLHNIHTHTPTFMILCIVVRSANDGSERWSRRSGRRRSNVKIPKLLIEELGPRCRLNFLDCCCFCVCSSSSSSNLTFSISVCGSLSTPPEGTCGWITRMRWYGERAQKPI